ncbi:hypothetical protein, partial [Bacillus sp. OTU2372]|uniref:hypothetical protein n=1 Tax=Bacillus sp. OTU2372 TaxID=3043858 RepID=UPI00313B0BA4
KFNTKTPPKKKNHHNPPNPPPKTPQFSSFCIQRLFCKKMLLFRGFSLVLIAFVKRQEKYIPDGE